jgi:hypothetical protein
MPSFDSHGLSPMGVPQFPRAIVRAAIVEPDAPAHRCSGNPGKSFVGPLSALAPPTCTPARNSCTRQTHRAWTPSDKAAVPSTTKGYDRRTSAWAQNLPFPPIPARAGLCPVPSERSAIEPTSCDPDRSLFLRSESSLSRSPQSREGWDSMDREVLLSWGPRTVDRLQFGPNRPDQACETNDTTRRCAVMIAWTPRCIARSRSFRR